MYRERDEKMVQFDMMFSRRQWLELVAEADRLNMAVSAVIRLAVAMAVSGKPSYVERLVAERKEVQ